MIFRLMGADVKKLVIPKPNDLCIYKNDETGYKISIRFIDDTYVLAIENHKSICKILYLDEMKGLYNGEKIPRELRDILRSKQTYNKWLIDVFEYLNNDVPMIKPKAVITEHKSSIKRESKKEPKQKSITNFKNIKEYTVKELLHLFTLNYKELSELQLNLKKSDVVNEILSRRKYDGDFLCVKICPEIPSVINFHFSFTLNNLIKSSWLEFGKEVRSTHPYCELTKIDEYKVQIHEVWGYDIENKVIILLDLMVLSPYCHNLQHKSHTSLMQLQGYFIDYEPNKQIKVIENAKGIKMKDYSYYINETSKKFLEMEERMKTINLQNANFFLKNKNSLDADSLIKNGWKFHIKDEYKGVNTIKMQQSLLKKNLLYLGF